MTPMRCEIKPGHAQRHGRVTYHASTNGNSTWMTQHSESEESPPLHTRTWPMIPAMACSGRARRRRPHRLSLIKSVR